MEALTIEIVILTLSLIATNSNCKPAESIFIVVPARLTVPEGSPLGHVLWNITAGSLQQSDEAIDFFIRGGVGEHYLSFKSDRPRHASLVLKERLAYHQIRKFSFYIVAISRTREVQVEKAVTVEVQPDDSGSGPFWQNIPYTCSLPEDATLGVQRSCAVYAWAAYNQTVTYHLLDATNTFSVDRRGFIVLNKKLDYFERQCYLLTAVAVDTSNNRNNSATVLVHVVDVPNNPPKFLSEQYYASVFEDSNVGKVIVRLRAAEIDVGVPTPIRYRLLPNEFSDLVNIDSRTGELSIRTRLSRSLPKLAANGAVFSIQVEAFKLDPFRHLSANVSVQISVLSVNTHRPMFGASTYYLTVNENAPIGTVLMPITGININVTDVDPGLNGLMRIWVREFDGSPAADITVSPNFAQSSADLVLSVLSSANLDYEKTKKRSMVIVASESSTRERYESSATVVLTIENLNDNAPQFTQSSYEFSVPENYASGSVVGRVEARDGDAGVFSALTYSVELSYAEIFQVSNNGEIRVASGGQERLDYERQTAFTFRVFATDYGNLTASTVVMVTLVNLDDCPPKFSSPSYSLELSELTQHGSQVFRVYAEDCDGTRSISYSLLAVSDSRLFSLNQHSGVLTLTAPLDYNAQREHHLQISAAEIPMALSTVVQLTIHVLQANVHPPRFTDPTATVFRVQEMLPAGSVIVPHIQAVDQDSGNFGKLQYRLLTYSPLFTFSEGCLVANKTVTLEYGRVHNLVVEALDNPNGLIEEQHRTFLKLTILIEDINNNAPFFRKPAYYVPLVDLQSEGRIVAAVEAYDLDQGQNARISYSIDRLASRPTSAASLLHIDPQTGVIRANFFNVTALQNVSSIMLMISANDHGIPRLTSSVPMTIYLEHLNRHAPEFSTPVNHSVTVLEDLGMNTEIYHFIAADDDLGESGIVRYRLPDSCADNRFFRLDALRGNLTSSINLNYEVQAVYRVCVEAYDLGVPTSLSTMSFLTVYLVDLNDNPPRFSVRSVTYRVLENVVDLQLLNATTATDLDSLSHNRMTCYYLIENDGHLQVDQSTGILKVTRPYDFETLKNSGAVVLVTNYCHDLYAATNVYATIPGTNITVADYDSPQLLSVRIVVEDANDNGPEFSQPVIFKDILHQVRQDWHLLDLQPFIVDADSEVMRYHFSKVNVAWQTKNSAFDGIDAQNLVSIKDDRYLVSNFATSGDWDSLLNCTLEVVDNDGRRSAQNQASIVLRFVATSKRLVAQLDLIESTKNLEETGEALHQLAATTAHFVQCTTQLTGWEIHVIRPTYAMRESGCADLSRVDVLFYAFANLTEPVGFSHALDYQNVLANQCNITQIRNYAAHMLAMSSSSGVNTGGVIAATSTLLGLFVIAFGAAATVAVFIIRKYRIKLQAASAFNFANKPCVVEGSNAAPHANAYTNEGFAQQSSQCTSMLCAEPIWSDLKENVEKSNFSLVKASKLGAPSKLQDDVSGGFDNFALQFGRDLPATTFSRVARKLYIPPAPQLQIEEDDSGQTVGDLRANDDLPPVQSLNVLELDSHDVPPESDDYNEATDAMALGVTFLHKGPALIDQPHSKDPPIVPPCEAASVQDAALSDCCDIQSFVPAPYEQYATKV